MSILLRLSPSTGDYVTISLLTQMRYQQISYPGVDEVVADVVLTERRHIESAAIRQSHLTALLGTVPLPLLLTTTVRSAPTLWLSSSPIGMSYKLALRLVAASAHSAIATRG